MTIKLQQSKSKLYTQQLTQKNMHHYYEQHALTWDSLQFDNNWSAFENYEMVRNNTTVGIVRLSFNSNICYIRDLQVEGGLQRQGIGTKTLNEVFNIAKTRKSNTVRLKSFESNPAINLYKKLGFGLVKHEQPFILMEKIIT
jgi:ribosomal protein S18 acetylase RimI-like enzyme